MDRPARSALDDLSEQVARLWMGWRHTDGDTRSEGSAATLRATETPPFARDARLASEALALARRRGFHCRVRVLPATEGGEYEVAVGHGEARHHSRGPTLPEAVCRALLALCGARDTSAG